MELAPGHTSFASAGALVWVLPDHTGQDADPRVCIVAVTLEDSSARGGQGRPTAPWGPGWAVRVGPGRT